MKEAYNNIGAVKISEEVIANIANLAACEIDGVVKLSTKTVQGAKSMVPNLKPFIKGVSVCTGADGIELTLNVIVKQGCKVQDVAKLVQSNVSDSVANMTGLSVKAVHIFVVGIVENKSDETK